MTAKKPYIGVYGPKTRALQSRVSYEHVSLSWKVANVWKYLGSRASGTPDIDDIQTTTFMEVPDRAYASEAIEVNIDLEPFPEQQADLSQFGIIDPTSGEQTFKMHTESFKHTGYGGLGRYVIVGDVIEMPFFEQDGNTAYWEITDVDRKQEFENFYVVVTARPLTDSRVTEEIPDKNTNQTVMDNIEADLQTEYETEVQDEGLDDTGVQVDDPQSGDTYDPRDKDQGSLLDDPNRTF